MSAVSNVREGQEMEVETVEEMEDGLVEVGAVSETKGGVLGNSADPFGPGRWGN